MAVKGAAITLLLVFCIAHAIDQQPVGKYGWAVVAKLDSTVIFDCELHDKDVNGTELSLLPVNTSRAGSSEQWLLPGSERWLSVNERENNVRVIGQGSKLQITNVTLDNKGIYLCQFKLKCDQGVINCTHQYEVRYMKHGLNLNGPLYADTLEKYRENFIIGGAAAGGLLGIILLLCLIYKFRYKSLKEEYEFELPQRYGERKLSDRNGEDNAAAVNAND